MAYRKGIRANRMTFQLVPPYDHHRNLTDKDIQTWKDHLSGVTSGTVATSPIQIWCKSHVNPKISAYAQVYGTHDYIAAPFLPIGTETLVYDNPKRRGTFEDNCSKV